MIATPQSWIEHELDRLDPVELSEVLTRVCDSMRASPDVYGDGDESDRFFVSRLHDMWATRAIAEIHEQIGLDSIKAY